MPSSSCASPENTLWQERNLLQRRHFELVVALSTTRWRGRHQLRRSYEAAVRVLAAVDETRAGG